MKRVRQRTESKRRCALKQGATLIELVIVLVVLAVILAFIYPVLSQAITAYSDTTAAVSAATKGRYALERIARELRDVRRSTADDALFDITTMIPSQMVFTRTDGVTVTVTGSGTTVTVGYSTPAVTSDLADQVTSAATIFRYLLFNGTPGPPVVTASNVRYVEATITLSQGSATYNNRVRIALRNPQ